jgi:sirohydrochlorin cobaltochelatase
MTTTNTIKNGIVLFAHGSRDALWSKPIESIAAAVQKQSSVDTAVRCAYLELMQPDLPTVTAELATLGVTAVRITPLFFGVGKHAREDLPEIVQQLKSDYPSIQFDLLPSIGEHPELTKTITKILLDV